MNSQSPTPLACPQCGAELHKGQGACWLCGARIDTTTGYVSTAPPRHAAFSFSLSTLILVMTIVAVLAALVAAAPGLGVFACIFLAPVLVRTAMVVRRRQEGGKTVSTGDKVALILSSFGVILVMQFIVSLAAFATLFVACLYSDPFSNGPQRDPTLVFLFAAAVAIALLIMFGRWIRARYLRDIERP